MAQAFSGIPKEQQAKHQEQESQGDNSEAPLLPPFEPFNSFERKDIKAPKVIIEGILSSGAKMSIGGGTISGKSWILVDLFISIGAGVAWLGKSVTSAKVLYVNFEMREYYFRRRLRKILAIKGLLRDLRAPI